MKAGILKEDANIKKFFLFPSAAIPRGTMLRIISATACALLLLFFHSFSAAASRQLLDDIRFESVSQDEERIVFQLTGSEMPEFFEIKQGHPRLVFDFFDTGVSKRIRNRVDINGQLIQRVRVGIHESKTRAVLDLVPGRQVRVLEKPDPNRQLLTVIVHDAAIKKPVSRTTFLPVGQSRSARKSSEQHVSVRAAVRPAPKKQEQPFSSSSRSMPTASVTQSVPVSQAATNPTVSDSNATVLSTVLFDKNSNRGEMVMFRLNKFHPPVVFGLEEGKPRVVCDFQDTVPGGRLTESVLANGKFVRNIRINKQAAQRKIRVVLDLMPNKSYDLQQVFFKNDNLFVLIINTLGASKHLQ